MTTYADKPWLKHYDEGVPHSLEPYPEIGLHDLLIERALESPDKASLITTLRLPVVGRKTAITTFGELNRQSDALAVALIEMGLQKGDRVAVVMPNVVAFAITYYAILKAGGVVAATNPTYPPKRMAEQIDDCDAEIVLCITLFYNMLKSIQAETKLRHVVVANIKEYFPPLGKTLFTLAREKKDGHYVEAVSEGDFWFQDLLAKHDGQKPDVEVGPQDLALFQYTGGTTGISKGAMATHRALVANMLQIGAFQQPLIDEYGTDRPTLGALPLFHVYGMVALLSRAVSVGTPIILVPNARDIDEVVDIIDVHKPASFPGVPQLFNAIANHPRVKDGSASLKSIVFSNSGSAPLPRAVHDAFEPLTSSRLGEGFGMSETPTATHTSPYKSTIKVGSIGLPLPDVECRIVSLDDGKTDVPVGDVGELIVASPNLMKGYHRMPTETDNALRKMDGKTWLFTGDIARMDEDGFFYIVDRKKDMALIGGFNVYPTNIEKVLKDHEAVLEVAVAAIAHPEREGQETLKAWVVLKEGMSGTDEELMAHCEQYLAPYEIPRRFEFIADLPKSAVGKTLRRELVKQEAEKQAQA